MTNRLMFTITSGLMALFGAGFLLVPEFVFDLFVMDRQVGTILFARFFGGVLLIAAILYWFVKDVPEAGVQKPMAFVSLAGAIGGFVLSLIGINFDKVIHAKGWTLLVLFGFFILAYAYMLFLVPSQQKEQPKQRAPRKPKTEQKAEQ